MCNASRTTYNHGVIRLPPTWATPSNNLNQLGPLLIAYRILLLVIEESSPAIAPTPHLPSLHILLTTCIGLPLTDVADFSSVCPLLCDMIRRTPQRLLNSGECLSAGSTPVPCVLLPGCSRLTSRFAFLSSTLPMTASPSLLTSFPRFLFAPCSLLASTLHQLVP